MRWARGLGSMVALACAWPSQGKADAVVTDCTPQALAIALVQGGQVTFTQACTITLSQAIPIIKDAALDAAGFAVTISGGGQAQIFNVATGINFSMSGLTLTSGRSTNGGALYINPQATVLLNNCLFTTNSAAGPNGIAGTNGANHDDYHDGGPGTSGTAGLAALGGAVFNLGTLVAQSCLFGTNSATGGNGGSGGNGGTTAGEFSVGGDGGNGGAGGNAWGGAIYNLGTLTLSNCTFSGNSLTGGNAAAGGTGGTGFRSGLDGVGATGGSALGAGVYSTTNVAIVDCTFATNTAQAGNSSGGGTLSNGEGADGVRGPDGSGGGVCSVGPSALTNCTFYGNTVVAGTGGNGGNGTGTLSNGGNGGNGGDGNGGGLFSQTQSGTNYVVNCTFANGGATGATNGVAGSGPYPGNNGKMGRSRGGNLANAGGNFWLVNSIIATNTSGGNGYGVITDGGRNVSSDTSLSLTTNSLSNTDPRLAALADNGGPTLTMALLAGSPAIDFAGCAAAPAFDQRGQPRPSGSACDSGAFELGWTLSGTVTSGANGLAGVLITATNSQATNVTWSVSTDESGNYILPLLPGIYTITPSSADYTFSPAQLQTVVTTNTTADFAAGTKVFSLAGNVSLGATGNGLSGVTVTAAGPATTNVAITTANGSYLVTGLPKGNYVITPSRACYLFSNTTATVYVQSDTNSINFSAVPDSYKVSGQITEGVTPVAGVTLTLGTQITQTDTNGQYVFTAVCGGNYSLTPSLACYQFSPASVAVSLTPGSVTNFSFGALHQVHSISGTISQGGAGQAGVNVQAGNQTATTDSNGHYNLTGLCPGTYTVTPVQTCLLFNPLSRSVTLGQDASGIDFVGYSNNVFSIRGQITLGNSPLASVTVSAGGNSAVSDANGNYVIAQLCPGQYNVVPTSPGYGFSPASTSVSVAADVSGVNFSAYPAFSISGQITEGTNGLAGVAVTTAGLPPVVTDTNGFYTISNAPAGTNLVVPSLTCYIFNPPSIAVTVEPGGTNGVNFAAVHDVHVVSGRITEGAVGLAGVTVQVGNQITNTDSQGYYTLPDLCPGTYTITPSEVCYLFNPPSRTASLGPDSSGLNFVAYQNRFTISGSVTEGTNGLEGVTVQLSGQLANLSALTDSGGNYLFQSLCAGSYTISNSPYGGYFFLPTNLSIAVSADTSGLNFSALAPMAITNEGNGAFLVSGLITNAYTYRLEAATNLAIKGPSIWLSLATNLPAPFQFLDTNTLNLPMRFYRMNR